jgi:MinD superfamily P-loop ATPase
MPKDFVVAVASGKGGTGKTTVAVNFAQMVCESGRNVQYLDCDVEEPNGHIFLQPEITAKRQVTVNVPQVDLEKCIACGQCGDICQFGAILCIKENVLVFEQLCHSCSGCVRICPEGAITTKSMEIGTIECGNAGKIDFVSGKLGIGHVRSPALIREVKKHVHQDWLTILDVPPGTSCPVVEAVKDADFVLLVTEPTPFGLNDLKLAVELARQLNLPFAVAVNRDGIGNQDVEKYCQVEKMDIAFRLPDDRCIAEAYSSGRMIVDISDNHRQQFLSFHDYLERAKVKLNDAKRLRVRI